MPLLRTSQSQASSNAPLLRGVCLMLGVTVLNGCAWLGWNRTPETSAMGPDSEVVCAIDQVDCKGEQPIKLRPEEEVECQYLFEMHQGQVLDPSEDLADADFSVYFKRLRRRFEVPRYAEFVSLGHAPIADGTGVMAEIAVPQEGGKKCQMYINKLRVLD